MAQCGRRLQICVSLLFLAVAFGWSTDSALAQRRAAPIREFREEVGRQNEYIPRQSGSASLGNLVILASFGLGVLICAGLDDKGSLNKFHDSVKMLICCTTVLGCGALGVLFALFVLA